MDSKAYCKFLRCFLLVSITCRVYVFASLHDESISLQNKIHCCPLEASKKTKADAELICNAANGTLPAFLSDSEKIQLCGFINSRRTWLGLEYSDGKYRFNGNTRSDSTVTFIRQLFSNSWTDVQCLSIDDDCTVHSKRCHKQGKFICQFQQDYCHNYSSTSEVCPCPDGFIDCLEVPSKCESGQREADVEYLFAHDTKRETQCRDGYEFNGQTETVVCDNGKWIPDVPHPCEDIDECKLGEHDCENAKHEKCLNTPGNYACTCEVGYVKVQDGCVPQNSEDEALGCEIDIEEHASCDDPTQVLGVTWPETKAGCSTEWIPCSGSAYGFMRRHCDGTGKWLAPDTSDCKSAALMVVLANVSSISTTSEANDQLDAVNRYLGNEENEDYGGDLLATVDVLREVTKTQPLALQGPPSTKQKYVQGFLGAIDKAVDDKNEDKWQNANKLLGPEKSILAVFELIDQFSKSLYNTVIDFQGTVDQTTNKIQLRAEILSSKHVLKRSLDEDKRKCNGTCVVIPSYLRATNSTEPLVMVTVVYNDPADIIPSKFVQSESNSRSWVKTITAIKKVTKVNTAVISVNIYINNISQLTHVEEPVLIEFTPIQLGYDAQCSYMKYGDATGVWSTEGCLTDYVPGSDKITCKCNHLTTFAVIMTLGKKPVPFPKEARDIVMQIACYLNVTLMLLSFCMVCTAGLQVDGHFVLVNIISSLILHPISIIWNLASNGDESPCKTVKFLWYFAILSNFAWVMNCSIHQFLKLRKFIIRKMSYRIAYTIIGWVIPFAMAFVSYNVETIYGAGWSCIDNPNGVELVVLCMVVSCYSLVTLVLSVKLHKLYYVVYGDDDTFESEQIWHEILSVMLVSATVAVTWIFCLIYVANGDLTVAYSCAGAVFVEGSVVYLSMCATNRELLQAARINICGSAEEKAAQKELMGYINQCDEVKAGTDVDSGDKTTVEATDLKPVVIHGAFGETKTSKSSRLRPQQTTEDDIEVTQL